MFAARQEFDKKYNKGVTLARDGRYQEALLYFNRCVELDLDNLKAYNGKGNALSRVGRDQEALICFNKCIELDPNHMKSYYNKGNTLNNLNCYEEALLCFNKCIESDPNHVNAYNGKGSALNGLNRHDEALICFDRCIELDPNDVNVYLNKGSALDDLKRFEEAIHCYNKCIELDPRDVDAYYNKGIALSKLNCHDEALLTYNQYIELDPNNLKVYHNKGWALQNLYRFEEALLAYDKCIEMDPKNGKAYYNKRIVLKKLYGGDDMVVLVVKYIFQSQLKEVRVDVVDIERICRQNSMPFSLEGGQSEVAISKAGLTEMRKLGEASGGLDEIGCLQIAMMRDRRVSDLLKRRILLGLFFAREGGLRVIKEDGLIVVPSFETQVPVPVSSLPQGTISFLTDVDINIPSDPPDVSFLCRQKAECGIPTYQIIGFILEELKKLPPSESLMNDRFNFRLKSYSSIMNKLFYRGKGLTDLLATTVSTDADLDVMESEIGEKGGILINEENRLNCNDCFVYRYVRILSVTVGAKEFSFPVYYEIVRKNFLTSRLPDEQYELDRLEFTLNPGQGNILQQSGFTLETPSCSPSPPPLPSPSPSPSPSL